FLQKPREKLLGQVLGLMGFMTTPPDKCVEGIPIGSAQTFQGAICVGRFPLTRSQHDSPMGCCEGHLLPLASPRVHCQRVREFAAKRNSLANTNTNAVGIETGKVYPKDFGTNCSKARLAMSKPSASSFWPA